MAAYNSQVVLIGKFKKEGSNYVRVDEMKMFPLGGKEEPTLIGTASIKVSSMTAAGTGDVLVVADYNLKVFSNQMAKQKEFLLPAFNTSQHLVDFYFSITFHDNHLYLAPMSLHELSLRIYHGPLNAYYVPLNQVNCNQLVQQDQPVDHSPELLLLEDNQQDRPGEESEKASEKTQLDPPAHSDIQSEIKSIEQDAQSRNGGKLVCQNEQIHSLEWKKLPPFMYRNYSNLATFGKRLVTVTSEHHKLGVEINAYSPVSDSWVVVADTGDTIHYDFNQGTIVSLDDTGQLMLIGGINRRDVYKLSITGMYGDKLAPVNLLV